MLFWVVDKTYHGGNYSTGVALLNKYIELLNNCFTKRQNNLAEISYYVYQVKKLFDNHKQICFGPMLYNSLHNHE